MPDVNHAMSSGQARSIKRRGDFLRAQFKNKAAMTKVKLNRNTSRESRESTWVPGPSHETRKNCSFTWVVCNAIKMTGKLVSECGKLILMANRSIKLRAICTQVNSKALSSKEISLSQCMMNLGYLQFRDIWHSQGLELIQWRVFGNRKDQGIWLFKWKTYDFHHWVPSRKTQTKFCDWRSWRGSWREAWWTLTRIAFIQLNSNWLRILEWVISGLSCSWFEMWMSYFTLAILASTGFLSIGKSWTRIRAYLKHLTFSKLEYLGSADAYFF